MKRVTYLLKDENSNVRARMTLPEEESVSLEPWMVHNINQRGWRLEAWETLDSGVQIHGWADWQGVADNLATVMRVMLAEEEFSEEEAEQVLEQAQQALDDYHVAQMEVSVAQVDAEPEPETPEEKTDG